MRNILNFKFSYWRFKQLQISCKILAVASHGERKMGLQGELVKIKKLFTESGLSCKFLNWRCKLVAKYWLQFEIDSVI